MSPILPVILAITVPPAASPNGNEIESQVVAVLTAQVEAWNRGDIDAFMETYWKSDRLSFSSGGETTRGWQSTRDRYHERYPNRKMMGKLTFSELEVTELGEDAVLLLGRWKLKREDDQPGGNFSLVMRRIEGQWKIIHDHTSKSD